MPRVELAMPVCHVYIVDDDVSMQDALQGALRSKGFAVQTFSTSLELLSAIDRGTSGVIVLDVEMPDMSGLELQRELVTRAIAMPIIFISGRSGPKEIVLGMKSGALDFLLKPFGIDELIVSIEEALAKTRPAASWADEDGQLARKYASLTKREREVLQAIGDGEMLKQIAFRLGVSNSVIKFHKANLMRKLECQTLSDLIAIHISIKRTQIPA